jgi:hypothetical protein
VLGLCHSRAALIAGDAREGHARATFSRWRHAQAESPRYFDMKKSGC